MAPGRAESGRGRLALGTLKDAQQPEQGKGYPNGDGTKGHPNPGDPTLRFSRPGSSWTVPRLGVVRSATGRMKGASTRRATGTRHTSVLNHATVGEEA